MKQEIDFYKKCLREVLFFEEDFTIEFKGVDIVCKNIIGPVVYYQKNAYKFLYDEDGKLKKRLISRPNPKKDKFNPAKVSHIYKDKRGHLWKKSKRDFEVTSTLNFKPYGRIETNLCPHINSANHTCNFCKLAWAAVKKKKTLIRKV